MEDIGWVLIQLSITTIFMQWAMSACCKRNAQFKVMDYRRSSTTTQSQTRSTDKSKSTEVTKPPPVKQIFVPPHSSDLLSSPTPTDDLPKPKEAPPPAMPKSSNSAEVVPKKDDSFSKRKPVVVEAKRTGFIQERGFVGRERDDYKTMRTGLPSSDFEDSV
ncbi:unnamed protein product [Bursaphelenchus xylophilus]|uniref:(pine wood nematode) hypothetical protein n=1 Tax=Bursaphelenchus xylophilus TaxID=6326 RepID=A0A1I7SFU9_BURXY|nr:unnamed protein product [Bursaphelenchus xylophilus]CAG9080975.1 unnamed protein product [Bursaphelenchus xylophilus]